MPSTPERPELPAVDTVVPSLAGLRALSHPTRLRILGMLRREGPATATSVALRLGVNTGATSYHLRQLAQHGFITDDAERGNGRERWWRAEHRSTTVDDTDVPPAQADVLDAYLQTVAVTHARLLQAAMEEHGVLPEEWRHASTLSDFYFRLTPTQARALVDRLHGLLDEVVEQESDGEDVADFVVQLEAFPRPGQLGGDPG